MILVRRKKKKREKKEEEKKKKLQDISNISLTVKIDRGKGVFGEGEEECVISLTKYQISSFVIRLTWAIVKGT